jgi:type IV pilus assembly protein PilM
MNAAEMRSALRYQIGELLPIPVDQAVFDFAVLGPSGPAGDGGTMIKVLVVAAQQDIVTDAIAVVKKAGLHVRAVDASPLALLRAVPPAPSGGLEAVVSLGAQLVVVGVRQGTTPRFLRTVTGGSDANRDGGMEPATAARGGEGQRRGAGGVGVGRLDPVAEEVRSSIEYFLSHNQGERLERVIVTGGAAMSEGLVERIRTALNVPVTLAAVGPSYKASQLHLSDVQVKEASARWATAVGLALWKIGPGPAPSLLPSEIRQRQQFHQALVGAGVGVLVVALGLGTMSYSAARTANDVKAQIAADNTQATVLQVQVNKLDIVTRVRGDVAAQRQLAVNALQGDVAWVALVHRIAAALPAGVTITALSLTRTPPAATTSSSGSTTQGYVGTLSLSGQTTNGPKSVSQVIDALSAVRGIGAVWVPNTTKAAAATTSSTGGKRGQGLSASSAPSDAGATTFSLEADITSAALSNRSNDLPGGGK